MGLRGYRICGDDIDIGLLDCLCRRNRDLHPLLGRHLFHLIYHGYGLGWTLLGAYPAPLAVVEVVLDIPIREYLDGHIRAEHIAGTAPNASVFIINWALRPPIAGALARGIAGLVYHATDVQLFPGDLMLWLGHLSLLLL